MIAKRAVPFAGKIATAGILDFDEITKAAIEEFVSSSVGDAVDAFSLQKSLITSFRENLEHTIIELQKSQEKNLIVFIDEIDRCRPDYAVELLERIKHLFNVKNTIFILAIDKQQLSVSLQAIYGVGLKTNEYLKRFIDLEFLLPEITTDKFTEDMYERFEFDNFFSERKHPELQNERSSLVTTFNGLSDLFGLSLRSREQCFTGLRVAMLMTPQDHHLYPVLLTLLVVLRAGAPELYRSFIFEDGDINDFKTYIGNLKGGIEFLSGRVGIVVEAHLISAKPNLQSHIDIKDSYKNISNDESQENAVRESAGRIISIIESISMRDLNPPLNYVVDKIELAAQYDQ